MPQSDLELCTTQELITELMRRQTFLGIVVHSEEELKRDWRGERTFKVHFNSNLDASKASRILETVADHMDECA